MLLFLKRKETTLFSALSYPLALLNFRSEITALKAFKWKFVSCLRYEQVYAYDVLLIGLNMGLVETGKKL